MRLGSSLTPATVVTGLVLLLQCPGLTAQAPPTTIATALPGNLPEAPQAPFAQAMDAISFFEAVNSGSGQSQDAPPPEPAPTRAPASSNSAAQASPADADKARQQKAEEQLKEEEKQRVLGIVPMFNTTYRSDAVSLTARQKISLAFRSSVDPATFAAAVLVAGYGEALDSDSGFPWGAKGFGERAGAKYLDAFDGTMIGNGILPSLLHQDPRYFRLGHGSVQHRLFYAVATSVICKHDNTGKWEPNYSNVLGNIASGALSNLYYPANDSGIGLTIGNGFVVTAEGAIGSVFQEFWPDLSRKLFHKDPTRGLDTQAQTAGASGQSQPTHQ